MHLDKLELKNFRNYADAGAEFGRGLNMIIGENGQGKTNLLEAVRVVCGAGSHRVASHAALVRHGAEQAIVRARGELLGRPIRIDAEIRAAGGVRYRVNGGSVEPGAHVSSLPASIIFSPDDLALVKGGPEERRRYLDDIAAQVAPLAGAERSDFEKILRQRNGVLKAAQVSNRAKLQLEVWTAQLAAAASRVVRNRIRVLGSVHSMVAAKYPAVAGRPAAVRLVYRPTWAEHVATDDPSQIEQSMSRAFVASSERDLERGMTLVGPHRDDVEIELEGAPARVFASQGEQRSLALGLRLAELDLVAEARMEPPILLLDDVFSELDESRRRGVAEIVRSGGQSFLTTTEPEALPLRAERVVRVEEGVLSLDG